ncbi:Membrane-bound lytic murein transglycosylase D [Andreprevotia sp. IGB-42]|uniref:transglycosylase SLT domain-containing protein n=1 Tax=Andreprevotia sp. IGB-42 TaxID=2497473 RepID=UPI00135A3A95|nr:transglycosylase SLT domain-containing protein [Andreprevotia sp. IGB-42]KAF0811612.1 Membrane-bound lytic murein transglycosylase D [Andreprevotia sp. IGB-42]
MLTLALAALLAGGSPNFNPDEPASVRQALQIAAKMESADPWGAAARYCRAARLGVTEAQYRLGILYAFGAGVPEDRKAAASLFSIAAQQGHAEAQSMLETIRYSADALPPCVLGNVDPAHAPVNLQATLDLDEIIAGLPKRKRWVAELVERMAGWYDVDPRLALTIATVESRFEPGARSDAYAMGVMQLIPATADRFNVRDAYNASQNIRGGLRYLRWLLDRYQGNVALAVAGYNAGEKAVDRHRGVPPYDETRQYVLKVRRLYPYAMHLPDAGRWPTPMPVAEAGSSAAKRTGRQKPVR